MVNAVHGLFSWGGFMFGFFLRWSINLLALIIAGSVTPGIRIQSIQMGILAAGILGVVNAVIRPVVLILTLPINLLTLGLFTLVINAALLKLVADLVPGFVIESFGAAFIGALVISLASWVLNLFVSGDGTFIFIKRVPKGGDRGIRR
jgi:putative membrane protein